MKKYFSILVFIVSIFAFNSSVFAFTVYEATGIVNEENISYVWSNDGTFDYLYISTNVGDFNRSVYSSTDSTFTNVISTNDELPSDYGWDYFSGQGLTCNTYYKGELYKGTDIVGTFKIHVTDLQEPVCDSSAIGNENPTSPETDCSSTICQCIEDLKNVLGDTGTTINNTINDATNEIKETINNSTSIIDNSIKEQTEVVEDIKEELQTDMPVSNYDVPDTSDKLEENKPSEPSEKFEDDTTYFEDEGQAPLPPDMPQAPEPECWEINGECMNAEEEQQVEETLEQDEEMEQDSFTLDEEMQQDSFSQDEEMQQDEFSQDEEMQQDEFSQDEEFERDTPLQSDIPMEQTEINGELRWNSNNGVFQ